MQILNRPRGKALIVAIALICALAVGLVVGNRQWKITQAKRAAAVTVDPPVVTAHTNLAFDLYHELAKTSGDKNLLISPTSIVMALDMAYNAAAGETERAMDKTLHHGNLTRDELNNTYADLMASLKSPDPKVELNIVNSLWLQQGLPFRQEFINQTQQNYRAQVEQLDFNGPGAAQAINDWVKKQTRGKIPQIIEQPNGVMTLVNAIYFNGEWSVPFEKSKTQARPFYLANGTQKQHPFMSQSGSYSYYQDDALQAIRLPYGGGRLAMVVLLPNSNSNLVELGSHLNQNTWDELMAKMSNRRGTISLPKFKYEYGKNLNETLKTLGMTSAFDGQKADFSRALTPGAYGRLFISQVIHKALIEVDERGTEAAAATAIAMTTSAPPKDQPFNMVVDHPFFFAIRDSQTGELLFMGSVVNPES